VQECAKIMDISEEVIFSTLAQIGKKELQDANKSYKEERKAFDVVQRKEPVKKVDVQYELEKKIIEILLLYGNKTEDFEDLVLKETEKGDLTLEPVIHKAKVFEKIYLDLQEDEMEFTNENFKNLYYKIIDTLNQNPEFALETFVNTVEEDMANEITTILMNDEKYHLSDWESKNIFPKSKTQGIPQLVNETILSLRCFLIDQKVTEFQQETKEDTDNNKTILEDVLNYSNLKMLLSRKLNRVL
jgi:DNA primase